MDAVAVAGQEDRRAAAAADQPVAAQQLGPRVGPPEVGGEVARGEERAHRRRRGQRVVGRPARQRHRLVEHRHALVDASALHVGQPAVGERLRLQLDVAEAASAVEGQLGRGQQLGRVVDLAAHRRRRPPIPARCTAARRRRAGGPGRTRPGPPAGCRASAEDVAQPHAHHRRAHVSSAAVSSRIAADRWATAASTSKRPSASSAAANARSASALPDITHSFAPVRCVAHSAANASSATSASTSSAIDALSWRSSAPISDRSSVARRLCR